MAEKVYEGQLCVLGNELGYMEKGPGRKFLPTPLDNMEVYANRFGELPAKVAAFLEEHMKRRKLLEASPPAPLVWPKSKEGYELDELQLLMMEGLVREMNGRTLIPLPPGFGKTPLGALGAYYFAGASVFLVPKDKCEEWAEHIDSWCAGHFTTIKVIKSAKDGVKFLTEHHEDRRSRTAVVISLGLIKDKGLCDALDTWTFRTLVVDEAHVIKDPQSQRAKAVFRVSSKTPACILLTGTPFTNKGGDLFSLMHALHPQVFDNFLQFSERYCGGKTIMGRWVETHLLRVGELLLAKDACFLKVTEEQKEAALKRLPPLTVSSVVLPEPSMAFKRTYDELKARHDALQQKCNDAKRENKEEDGARFERQRQAEVGKMCRLTGKEKAAPIATYVSDTILPNLGPRQSVAVFCIHHETAQLIEAELRKRGQGCVVVTGNMPAGKRREAFAPFKMGTRKDDCKVLVLTLNASYQGIQLQPGVTVVIQGEYSFTPYKEDQAPGRAHRKGATDPIQYIRLELPHSSDTRTTSIQGSKENKRIRLEC